MSWYCGLLTVLNVLDGLGRTGGPACRESSPTCECKQQLRLHRELEDFALASQTESLKTLIMSNNQLISTAASHGADTRALLGLFLWLSAGEGVETVLPLREAASVST